MDIIREKFLKDDVSKELLAKIDELIKNKPAPNILVTSSQMTKAIIHSGISKLYEGKINFVYTLGCPYCYTPTSEVDTVLELIKDKNIILVIKPKSISLFGTESSIKAQKQLGANIEIVNREIDCLKIAQNNPEKEVVFLSAGFESDTPSIAGLIMEAEMQLVKNISVILTNKLLAPAVRNLMTKTKKIDGYLAPGDISIITGTGAWNFIPDEFEIPVVISGFEKTDILYALENLLGMINDNKKEIINAYSALVSDTGNPIALDKTFKIFMPKTTVWKGYGLIPFGGLTFQEEYSKYDAYKKFDIKEKMEQDLSKGCNNIATLKKMPQECERYKKDCTLEDPKSTDMSSEDGLCYIFCKADSVLLPDLKASFKIIE